MSDLTAAERIAAEALKTAPPPDDPSDVLAVVAARYDAACRVVAALAAAGWLVTPVEPDATSGEAAAKAALRPAREHLAGLRQRLAEVEREPEPGP